jgi:hypothetical protein
MKKHDEGAQRELEARAKRVFDESVEQLDAHTRSRLTQARFRALREPPRRPWWPLDWSLSRHSAWTPAAAAVASLVVGWALWQGRASPETDLQVASVEPTDLEILLAEEDLALLEELDFYDWLERQPEFAAPTGADGVG